jgi:hypothetical protein
MSNLPDSRIAGFLKEHHVVTLSVFDGSDIWSWHAFYVYLKEENLMVVTSEEKTRHVQMLHSGGTGWVAGGVALETETIGLIRGVQLKGVMEHIDGSLINKYRLSYLRRFPYAILKGGDLWVIRLTELKFTDNRLGFGKKLLWKSDSLG